VLLPSAKPLAVFRGTQSDDSPSVPPFEGVAAIEPSSKEKERVLKWRRMLSQNPRLPDNWEVESGKMHKFRRRVYKGIPDCWRLAAWDILSRERTPPGQRKYNDLLEVPSEYDIQIDLDVPRTISGHVLFRTRYGLG
jgi:USP6 N-terminal-like protein